MQIASASLVPAWAVPWVGFPWIFLGVARGARLWSLGFRVRRRFESFAGPGPRSRSWALNLRAEFYPVGWKIQFPMVSRSVIANIPGCIQKPPRCGRGLLSKAPPEMENFFERAFSEVSWRSFEMAILAVILPMSL